MKTRNIFLVLALMSLLATVAMAASIDGKWKSEMPGRDGTPQVTNYVFKSDGEKLTGTVSGRQGDTAITDGKVKGDEISFVVVRNFGGQERKMEYKGKVTGDELKLTVQFGPDAPPREITAKRVKE